MDDDETEADTAGGQRVTVFFSEEDMSRITAAVARRTAASGYKGRVSDAMRELVRTHWPVPKVPS